MLRYVGGILNQNNARMVKNSALTKDLQNAVSASNEIQDKEEAFVRRGTKYSKEYSASFKVRQAEADLQGLAAGGASWAINKATGLIGKNANVVDRFAVGNRIWWAAPARNVHPWSVWHYNPAGAVRRLKQQHHPERVRV